MLSHNVMTALGLNIIVKESMIETAMDLSWMFIGMTMFGYGIGNISSYLSNAIQDEQEYLNSINFQNKLCTDNKIDYRIQSQIINDIENY